MPSSSDSDSSNNSDKGIRYKTDSIRNKNEKEDDDSSRRQYQKRKYSKRKSDSSSDDEKYRRSKSKKESRHKREKAIRNNKSGESGLDTNRITVAIDLSQKKPQIGPTLPSHFTTSNDQAKEPNTTFSSSENEVDLPQKSIGPMLPPHLIKNPDIMKSELPQIIGPSLPPHLQKSFREEDTNAKAIKETSPEIIGPALPPHLQQSIKDNSKEEDSSAKVIGPTLPPHLRQQLAEASSLISQEESDEDDSYGPLPIGATLSKSHLELEERAWQMKIDQLNPQGDEPKREDWMLELPEVKAANLGLGPRTFRMKAGPDLSDRTSWTDTPQDKARKKEKGSKSEIDIRKEAEIKSLQKRDKEQEELVKKSKRSKDSLVDVHMKKLKDKKKDEVVSTERRPFSRDVDLQVNKFDEAQKKAILKKAQMLDDRFSAGQSKFL